MAYLVRFTPESWAKHGVPQHVIREILREAEPVPGWSKSRRPAWRWEAPYPGSRWKRVEVMAEERPPDAQSGGRRILLVFHAMPDYGKRFKPWPPRDAG